LENDATKYKEFISVFVCLLFIFDKYYLTKMSKIRKIIDDVRQNNGTEIDLVDKGIVHLTEAPGLCEYSRNTMSGNER